MSYWHKDTGFINTYESRIHIDWLTLTFNVGTTLTTQDLESIKEDVLSSFFLFNVADAEEVNQRIYVQYGSYTGYFNRNVKFAESYDDFGDLKGFMIDFSGTGLKSFNHFIENDISTIKQTPMTGYDVIKKVLRKYNGVCRITRLDLANDLFDAPVELTPAYIYFWAKYCDGLRSKAKYIEFDHSGQMGVYNERIAPSKADEVIEYLSDSETEGTTLYIGKCPHRIRIYNKKAEQAMKDNPVNDEHCNWIRWELELRGDYSTKFVDYWLSDCHEDLVMAYYGWLGQRFQFIDNDGSQKRRDRYPVTDWYDDFIDYTTTYPKLPVLINAQPKSSVYRKLNWISNGGALNALKEIKNGAKDVFIQEYPFLNDSDVDKIVDFEIDNIMQSLNRNQDKRLNERETIEKLIREKDYAKELRNQINHDNSDFKPIQNNTKAVKFDDKLNPFI